MRGWERWVGHFWLCYVSHKLDKWKSHHRMSSLFCSQWNFTSFELGSWFHILRLYKKIWRLKEQHVWKHVCLTDTSHAVKSRTSAARQPVYFVSVHTGSVQPQYCCAVEVWKYVFVHSCMCTSEVRAATWQVWTAVLIKTEAYLFRQIQMTQTPERVSTGCF